MFDGNTSTILLNRQNGTINHFFKSKIKLKTYISSPYHLHQYYTFSKCCFISYFLLMFYINLDERTGPVDR